MNSLFCILLSTFCISLIAFIEALALFLKEDKIYVINKISAKVG